MKSRLRNVFFNISHCPAKCKKFHITAYKKIKMHRPSAWEKAITCTNHDCHHQFQTYVSKKQRPNLLVAVCRAVASSTAFEILVMQWSCITEGASQWRYHRHYSALLHNYLLHWLTNQRYRQHLTPVAKHPTLYTLFRMPYLLFS